MSMTQQIRDALAGGRKTFAELHGQLGGADDKLKALLAYLRKNGEINIDDDDERTIQLVGGGAAAARKGKKPAAAKKARRAMRKAKPARKAKRPYKSIADKHAAKDTTTNGAGLHALALDNLVHAGILLRQACDGIVEDCALPSDFEVAKQAYDRAAQIHAAAKNA